MAARAFALGALRLGLGMLALASLAGLVILLSRASQPAGIATAATCAGLAVCGAASPRRAAAVLTRRGAVLALATALAAVIAIDASDRDALGFISFPVVAIAAVVTSKRWLAATMAVAIAGYAAGLVASGASLDSLTHGRPFNELANEAFDLILVAIVAQGVVGIMRRALRDAPANLGSVRRGGASLTPELATAVRRGSQRQLSRGDPAAIASTLSHSEHQVVEILRAGLLPKQAASELGVSLATVRTHIANAKRKSGARTVEQLVGLIAEAGASTRAAVTPTELADD